MDVVIQSDRFIASLHTCLYESYGSPSIFTLVEFCMRIEMGECFIHTFFLKYLQATGSPWYTRLLF